MPIADPSGNGLFFPSGAHKIRGFETAVTGHVTPDWQTSLGYAYTDARITSDTSATIVAGNRVQLVPYNQFSLWNKYQMLKRLGVGVGLVRRTDMFASIDNSVVLPAYTRVDGAVFYSFNERWRLQANIENMLDTRYYQNADNNTNISPGSPRAMKVAMVARF